MEEFWYGASEQKLGQIFVAIKMAPCISMNEYLYYHLDQICFEKINHYKIILDLVFNK